MKTPLSKIGQVLTGAAERSTCRNIKLGALIVTPDGRMVEGWNGPPERCGPHEACRVGGPITPDNIRNCPGVHAEVRAICRAAAAGIPVAGGTIHLSQWFPCAPCARALIEAGIVRLVVKEPAPQAKDDCYNFRLAVEMLETAGVEIQVLPDDT